MSKPEGERPRLSGCRREVFGDNQVGTLMSMQVVANIPRMQKQYDEAEALTGESLEGMEAQFGDEYALTLASICLLKTFGPPHARTQVAVGPLAEVYRKLGEDDKADALTSIPSA